MRALEDQRKAAIRKYIRVDVRARVGLRFFYFVIRVLTGSVSDHESESEGESEKEGEVGGGCSSEIESESVSGRVVMGRAIVRGRERGRGSAYSIQWVSSFWISGTTRVPKICQSISDAL